MKLTLIAFGKLKTPGLRDAADYYHKLIRTWCPIEEIELKPVAVPDKSPATRVKIQEKEGQLLLNRIQSEGLHRKVIYLLDETGKACSTEDWAKLYPSWESEGISHAIFCVGSSLGFSQEVRKAARGSLSLGPQTLPHELARVVLLEQLYRSYSITQGHPYHNSGS